MNNQEKNTYVRSQILGALLKMMQEQPFADISISARIASRPRVKPTRIITARIKIRFVVNVIKFLLDKLMI